MNVKSQMITQTTIISMGWTKTMIKSLLPEPTEKPNPHYKCAYPMKLWKKEKVLEIMETDDFKQALEKANKRHNLISYDSTLLDNKGKIGKDEAYLTFKKAVLDRISVIYPKYAAECQRQAELIGVPCYA